METLSELIWQAIEQTLKLSIIWDAVRLMWRYLMYNHKNHMDRKLMHEFTTYEL